jgi:LysR family glycine cleavage system transcriptional activator
MNKQHESDETASLNALRVFVAAAEHLSFTRAANALHLTQGAVSRHVQTLEEFYGTSLFIRQARGLALTAEGEALVKPARDAFQLLHEASEMLRLRQSGLRVRIPPRRPCAGCCPICRISRPATRNTPCT